MTDPLRAETERLLALDGRTARDATERVLRKYALIPNPDEPDNIAALFEQLRALQAENDRLQGDLKHLREVRDPGGCECSDDDACMFARQRDAFKAECEALRSSIRELVEVEDEYCRWDHDGYCQAHNLDHQLDGCRVARARSAMNRERGE